MWEISAAKFSTSIKLVICFFYLLATDASGNSLELILEDMPVTVAVDHRGVSIHQTGPALWAQKIGQMEVEFRP